MNRLFALTQGDPDGIGPDITLMAQLRGALPRCVVLGDPAVFRARARQLNLDVDVRVVEAFNDVDETMLNILPCGMGGADTTIQAIERGTELVMQSQAAALITNPISKAVLMDHGFAFPGHTEFLGVLAQRMVRARSR